VVDFLSADTYKGREGEKFTIHVNSSESLETELVDVSVYNRSGQYSFSVVFRGPADRYVEQGTFKLSHDELGEQEMFICPITYPSTEPGIHYELCVNQLLDPEV